MDVHLVEAPKWEPDDKLRFVYVCVIAGLVMAKDEKKKIPLSYIKLVMDLDKLRAYPWGLHSFDYLVTSIMDTRKELKKTNSYILNGFSFALQVWVMEAIPVVGELLGEKINKEFTNGARCYNWKGAAKVSYQDIIIIEQSFGPKDIVYPYISRSGNFDIIDDIEFFRHDEIDDVGVKNVNDLVRSGYDFRDHEWGHVESNDVEEEKIEEVVNEDDHVEKESDGDNQLSGLESSEKKEDVNVGASSTKKRKTKQIDHGAESRKMQLLCQRAATSFTHGFDEEIKSFIKGMFEASFKPFKEEISQRLKKVEEDVSEVKEILSTIASTSTQATPSSFKPKDVGKSPSVQPKSLEDNFLFDDLFTKSGAIDLNIESQDLLGTQDFLAKTIGHLSQKPCVPGVDPPIDAGKYDEDADLVFVSEVRWNALEA
ncbi:PREDICTED: uncharacterized protein LOC104771569 [Camelina sativa]|uniref:Uncharacterized protein LOC104771569 n=1 Tax=Camelina sativa TaxID=90675 RepID=A0ABM0Y2E3_CAMSA|nr:PREDICTED: uncharacterized protein LOC104771569 [Camelina sativa]